MNQALQKLRLLSLKNADKTKSVLNKKQLNKTNQKVLGQKSHDPINISCQFNDWWNKTLNRGGIVLSSPNFYTYTLTILTLSHII
jgi:hypothetical protein